VFFTFNGTAANALSVSHLCQSYHGILCHEMAHMENDECGAPEFFSNGAKVLLVPGADGKISPEQAESLVLKRSDIHFPKARVLSLTQATECGTTYSVAELNALQSMARRHGLKIHMDGSRFANAVASLDVAPRGYPKSR
jgi:threonine aldolase